jgi:hypothetical protein
MDANDAALIAYYSIAAASKGQPWIVETFGQGTWAARFYLAVLRLHDTNKKSWRIHLLYLKRGPSRVSKDQMDSYRRTFRPLLREQGIDLTPLIS